MNKTYDWINGIEHGNFIEIARVLAHSNAIGKGQFYVCKDQDDQGNFILALSKYGNSFVFYELNIPKRTVELISGKNINPPY